MGNEQDINNNEKRKKRLRDRNVRTIASDEEDSDQDDGEENEQQIEECDKEISKMLFDEEAELDEGERLKKNRKKMNQKEELKSYAQQIAEEQFMEEINRSKSVNKLPTCKRGGDSDDDSDSDDFNAYQRWKQKNKKKKEKEKEKNGDRNNIKTNNIKIEVNDDDERNDKRIKKEKEKEKEKNKNKNKRKRNISNTKDQRNIRTERNRDNDILNINEEIEKKNNKKSGGGGFFGFLRRKKDKPNENNNINNINQINQKPQNNMANNTPNNMLMNNGMNQNNNQMNNNQMYNNNYNNQMYNGNQMSTNPMYGVPNSMNMNMNMNGIGQPMGQDSALSQQPYMRVQSANQPFFGTKTQISKNAYSRIKPEDLKVVILYMKNSNNKSQEGLDLCGKRQYDEALKSFLQAKNSYMSLRKIMNNNPRAYPDEFKMVIFKKINEKLTLVHQSISECSGLLKEQRSKQILTNPEKSKDILRNISQTNNFNNINNINFNNNNNNFNNNNNNNNNQNKNKSIHDKEEDEMDEKIMSEIMVNNPGVKFDDIIGMKEMKRILYEIIVVPTIRPDLFTGIRKPQRGILLFGPPGTGKTMIAKAIASECHSTFFNISASSLTSKWVGESEKTVKSLFKIAYKRVPSIIFIDEIDSILSKRSESENEATKRLKTEFLIQFDGMGSNTNARLLVIAATNRPMDLDEALLRRLPKRVYCGPLDEEGRFEFIKKVINRVETQLSDRDIQEVAKMTKGYSNSDLKQLCKEAAFMPVRELTMDQILRIKKFRPLVKKDLIKACQKIRGTLSPKIINELLVWNEQFGGV